MDFPQPGDAQKNRDIFRRLGLPDGVIQNIFDKTAECAYDEILRIGSVPY